MLTCRELTEVVTDYLEGRMSFADRLRFRAHVNRCPDCLAYLDQVRYTILTLGRLPPAAIPPGVREKLLAQFRDWKR